MHESWKGGGILESVVNGFVTPWIVCARLPVSGHLRGPIRVRGFDDAYYDQLMLRYHVAFYLPRAPGEMVVAEALDFPGAVTQGFDLQDARLMIASALEDLAQALLEDGKPLPVPTDETQGTDADLIELVPLSVHAGTALR